MSPIIKWCSLAYVAGMIFTNPSSTQASDVPEKSFVIVDYNNKQNIKGNISLAMVWGEHFVPPQRYLRGFIHLKEALVKWTGINVEMDKHLTLSSPRLLSKPFIYITTEESFDTSKMERDNLKKYLENGGFIVLENPIPQTETSPAEASLKQMIIDVLGSSTKFVPIPNDHPLYNCFWDFSDGPPNGAEIDSFNRLMTKPVIYLEGVWIRNRLAVVFSNKGYIVKWTQIEDNIPQLKMGVNMVVFALRQEGGIALKQ